MNPRFPVRNYAARLALLACLPLIAACGGGSGNPLASTYTFLGIDKLDRPSTAGKDSDVTVESHAYSTGEISGGDLEWNIDQTSGSDVGTVSQTLNDDNHTAKFSFRTPNSTTTVCFTIKVQTHNHYYADRVSFCTDVR